MSLQPHRTLRGPLADRPPAPPAAAPDAAHYRRCAERRELARHAIAAALLAGLAGLVFWLVPGPA